MTFQAYIPYSPETNQERAFENQYERGAAVYAAKALYRVFEHGDSLTAWIVHPETLPAGAVLLTRHGIGVISFVEFGGPVYGTENDTWYRMERGVQHMIYCPPFRNPFEQVRAYGQALAGLITEVVSHNQRQFPFWLGSADRFQVNGGVVFTGPMSDLRYLRVSPKVSAPWYHQMFLDDVPKWAGELAFSRGIGRLTLTAAQVDLLVQKLFDVRAWEWIGGQLQECHPYARLWVVQDGKPAWPMALDAAEMTIGHDSTNMLLIDQYPRVARFHACFRKLPGGVGIRDMGSKSGTWVNGQRLGPHQEYILKAGDRIVLGDMRPVRRPNPESCELTFEAISPATG